MVLSLSEYPLGIWGTSYPCVGEIWKNTKGSSTGFNLEKTKRSENNANKGARLENKYG